jgi:hypothetical protein
MNNRFGRLCTIVLIIGFLFTLTGTNTWKANAETTECYWNGDISTDWYTAGNWDCNQIPMTVDYDVVIPSDGATRYPVLPSPNTSGVRVNSILIQTDGVVTVDWDSTTSIIANSFINNGTIDIVERFGNFLKIYGGTFNNNGVINIGTYSSWLILSGSGTHNGSFIGNRINFNQAADRQTNTFTSLSSIDVREIYIQGNHEIDIDGLFDCSHDFDINNNSKVTISTSGIVDTGNISIDETSELIYRITDGTFDPGTDLNISPGETLSGEGSIQANLTNAGTVSPGTSPGTITVDGNYTQESTGTLSIELGGLTAGSEHDQLVITGSADLDGILEVNLIDPFTPGLNDTFTIMTYGSRTGRFDELHLADLSAGLGWQIEYGLEELTLHVVDASASISGTVIYIGEKGFNPITVGLFEDPTDPPVKSLDVTSTTGSYPYTFDNLISGTYYIGALMDLNGNHQPDPDEPFALYSVAGEPFVFELDPGETIAGIDFTLSDPSFIFLPLILR